MVCMGCHHWQVDVSPRAVREIGGLAGFAHAVATAHTEDHDCPGAGGRIKVLGQWVERPPMASGAQADAVLGAFPLPRWWVWK